MLKNAVLVLIVGLIFSTSTQGQKINVKDIEVYKEFKTVQTKQTEFYNSFHKDSLKGTGYKPFKRWEAFYKPRMSAGNFRTSLDIHQDYQKLDNQKNHITLQQHSASWQEVGPVNVHEDYTGTGLGRVNCLEIHPKNDNIMWIGSAMGGAWKTTDKGKNWECADFSSFLSMGVSDIQISESNPDIMYIATGDDDGVTMTTGYTVGIIKSIDGGETWSITGLAKEIEDHFLISSIYIYPDDSEKLVVSTSKGIYRSLDGGEEWELVSPTPAYYRNLTPVLGTDSTLLVSTYKRWQGNSKLYRSEDRGATWTEVWTNENAMRMRLATTPDDKNMIYMIVADKNGAFDGIYKSTDKGINWQLIYNDKYLLSTDYRGRSAGRQGYYNLTIAVSPKNKNHVVVGGVNIWHSTNGGQSFDMNAFWSYSKNYAYVHADHHFMIFNDKGELFNTNDGGVYMNDNNMDKNSWVDLTSGLSVGQFYKISVANTKDLHVIAGSQDNGSDMLYDGQWSGIGGGDGMDNAINPNDRGNMYWSVYNGTFFAIFNGSFSGYYYNDLLISPDVTGEAGAWVSPIKLDPKDNTVYIGHNNVWMCEDGGKNGGWKKVGVLPTANSPQNTVGSIAIGYNNDTKIYYASVKNQLLRKVGNEDWKSIYSAPAEITSIDPDLENGTSVWVSLSGFASTKIVYIHEIENNRFTTDYSTGIPNVPVNDILIMDDNETMFCGTDIGVFIKESKEKPWILFGQGMPSLIINDLEYNKQTQTLYAGTYGRGLWQTKINNCSIEEPIITYEGDLEFCEGDSVTFTLENAEEYESFHWSNKSTDKTIKVKESTSLFATVENSAGCFEVSQIFTTNRLNFNSVKVTSSNGAFAFVITKIL
jgi:photosystem II stability/assembly factor-like uncharacterized protein